MVRLSGVPVTFADACARLLRRARTARDADALEAAAREMMTDAKLMADEDVRAFVTDAMRRASELRGPVSRA